MKFTLAERAVLVQRDAAPAYTAPPVYTVPAPLTATMLAHTATRSAAASGLLKGVGSGSGLLRGDGQLACDPNVIEWAEILLRCMSLLLAQSGHHDRPEQCLLLGVKRTSRKTPRMSAYDL